MDEQRRREPDPNEVGALWQKTSQKGIEMLSGTVLGQEVVAFKTRNESGRGPTWRVLKSRPRPESRD